MAEHGPHPAPARRVELFADHDHALDRRLPESLQVKARLIAVARAAAHLLSPDGGELILDVGDQERLRDVGLELVVWKQRS